jgi:TM2 domain-containing membrane protein YozV
VGFIITIIIIIIIIIILLLLLTAIGSIPGGSGYFKRIQNMKLVTTKFESGGLHEKHVVATWKVGNHLSVCF